MNKRLVCFLFITVGFFVFSKTNAQPYNFQEAFKNALDNATAFNKMLNGQNFVPSEDGGQVIYNDTARVNACLAYYTSEMNHQGFTPTANNHIRLRRAGKKITNAVSFGGKGLYDWIDSILKLPRAQSGKNILFYINLGMYTSDFVSKYLPNDSSKKGRTTTFIIPYYADDFKNDSISEKKIELFKSGRLIITRAINPIPSAYDLGNLHP